MTVAQFRAFVEDAENDGFRPQDPGCLKGVPNHPVVSVSWGEAMAYCTWLTETLRASDKTPAVLATRLRKGDGGKPWVVTLASEAEWEKAARGDDGRIYPWEGGIDSNRANYDDTGIGGPSAVGCFPLGASRYTVEELSGNVLEWTRSRWTESYKRGVKPDAARRVARGGAFDDLPRHVRAASCRWDGPVNRSPLVGFRVVVSPFSSDL